MKHYYPPYTLNSRVSMPMVILVEVIYQVMYENQFVVYESRIKSKAEKICGFMNTAHRAGYIDAGGIPK